VSLRKLLEPRPDEPRGIDPAVWRLVRPYEEFVGPNVFVMRLAFWSAVGGREFAVGAAIADHADYLNAPGNEDERARLVSACRWIRWKTPPAPVWLLSGEMFDPSQWFTGVSPDAQPQKSRAAWLKRVLRARSR
jgi:hypothetical protein